MNTDSYVTLFVSAVAMFGSWAVWVTVMIFELKEKIKLMRMEIEVLKEVKDLLSEIKIDMNRRGHRG